MEIYKDRFLSAMLGVMVFLVFQPYEFPDDWRRYPTILAFMVVSVAGVMASEFIVTKVLRMPNDLSKGMKYIARRNWFFVPLNIVILTLSITTLFYLVDTDATIDYFSVDRVAYLALCLICISIFQRLFWQNRYNAKILTQELCEAQRINGILQERERMRSRESAPSVETHILTPDTNDEITITGTTRESLQLHVADLLFVESSGNYVTIHYLKDNSVARCDIRTSIKEVVELLAPYSYVMRCHRAFIVNLTNVTSVDRRNSGMELQIRDMAERVPVSKSYIQELKQRLQNPEQ